MKLIDRLKKDRAVLATLQGAERRHFIWDYYKIPIVAVCSLAVLLVLSAFLSADARDTAMYAVFVNSDASYVETDLEALNDLLAQGGIDMEGKTIDLTAGLTLGQSLDEVYDGQTTQVLAAMFGISGLDVFAADRPVFDRYASQNAFVDLSLFLEKDLLQSWEGGLYYCTDSNGHEIVGGIILPGDSVLHQAGFYHDEVIVGAAGNAQYLEEAVVFIRMLLGG